MALVEEKYRFNGKRMEVHYDPEKKEPYPVKIRYMYNDWYPSETVSRERWFWVAVGFTLGAGLLLLLR